MMLASLAFAAQLLSSNIANSGDEVAKRYEHAEKWRVQGAVLMALGVQHLAPALVMGSIDLGSGLKCRQNPGCLNEDYIVLPIASVLAALGVVFTVIGIPLYIAGTNRAARLRPRLQLEPRGNGLALRF